MPVCLVVTKRLEEARAQIAGDSRAVVGDVDLHRLRRDVRDVDPDVALTIGDALDGVAYEVEEDLHEAPAAPRHRGNGRAAHVELGILERGSHQSRTVCSADPRSVTSDAGMVSIESERRSRRRLVT